MQINVCTTHEEDAKKIIPFLRIRHLSMGDSQFEKQWLSLIKNYCKRHGLMYHRTESNPHKVLVGKYHMIQLIIKQHPNDWS